MSETAWRPGFESIEADTPDEVELPVTGMVPADLAGTLYRIGPAGFEVAGDRYEHWFDGDAMIHALRFVGGRVFYRSRWVLSSARIEEDAAGRRLYGGGFWTPPPGGPIARARHARPKNVANINVIAHGSRLLALSEGGWPISIDPTTLATIGEDDLGVLQPGDGFSAHPKFDPVTGECWNFGVRYGPSTHLSLYRGGADGVWSVTRRLRLDHPHMVHDMALTERSVVIVCSPFVLPRVPLRLMTGWQGYGQALRWRPALGTTVIVIDRTTGESRVHRLEPFFVFHLAGAGDDGSDVTFDACTYPDADVVAQFLTTSDATVGPTSSPRLERFSLSARGTTRTPLADVPFEFPRHQRGGGLLGLTGSPNSRWLNDPCRLDVVTGRCVQAGFAPWELAGECVAVDDHVLTVVLDAARATSELRILAGDLEGPPVTSALLPHRVPLGLHGNFVRTTHTRS